MYSSKEGHFDAVYRIFRYLQKKLGKNPRRIAYHPMYELTDDNVSEVVGRYLDEWKYFYPDDQEMIPRHMPEVICKYVVIKDYVDATHAGIIANRRSHSGIIIYVNHEPIICYSRLHSTVEASSFGLDFIALRIATETIEAPTVLCNLL